MISGLASLMSRFIFRMIPICSSLLRSEYLSSLAHRDDRCCREKAL